MLLLSGVVCDTVTRVEPDQTMDVLEGENVLLECRFSAAEVLAGGEQPLFFWIRTNRKGHDNVAIGETQLENNYS